MLLCARIMNSLFSLARQFGESFIFGGSDLNVRNQLPFVSTLLKPFVFYGIGESTLVVTFSVSVCYVQLMFCTTICRSMKMGFYLSKLTSLATSLKNLIPSSTFNRLLLLCGHTSVWDQTVPFSIVKPLMKRHSSVPRVW